MDLWLFLAIIIVGSPIAKAIALRIRQGGAADLAGLRESMERLEDMDIRLEETARRLVDFEERLDYTERVLAQQRARDQLNP
ncbi:MAG TPA: hypothetical protein VGA22_10640 [Gemmatimonadales bacterium]|jgi:hypothetical protein